MKQKQSAKDLAFEKERAKFRKKIRELEHEINSLQYAIMLPYPPFDRLLEQIGSD